MSINISFMGEDRSERVGFIADSLKYNTDIGKSVILLADEYTFGLADGYVLSPGYGNDRPVDLALEALCAAGNAKKGAEILSRILVSDEDVRNAREPFWERSARRIVKSIALTAARAEAFMRKNTQPPHMSLSARMGKVFSEAADSKLSRSKEKLWWEKYDDKTIRTLIMDNAPNTAAGMISVMQSVIDMLCRISASERTRLLETDRPIIIYGPAYSEDELRILLEVLELKLKDAVLLVPEAHERTHLLDRVGFDTVCSTVKPIDGKTVIFGRQGTTAFFKSKVYETTGFERLTSLEYETPDMLPPGKALMMTGTKWDIIDVSRAPLRESHPEPAAEEEDETIRDLLYATPKEAREHDTGGFVTEKDVEEFGLGLVTDDSDMIDLDEFLDEESQ
jgi:hypothetical protein